MAVLPRYGAATSRRTRKHKYPISYTLDIYLLIEENDPPLYTQIQRGLVYHSTKFAHETSPRAPHPQQRIELYRKDEDASRTQTPENIAVGHLHRTCILPIPTVDAVAGRPTLPKQLIRIGMTWNGSVLHNLECDPNDEMNSAKALRID